MMKREFLVAVVLSAGIVAAAPSAQAGSYPTNRCVSTKMKAAGKFCQTALQAWSAWHQSPPDDPDGVVRESSIEVAALALAASFSKAEYVAAKKNSDCIEATATASQLTAGVEAAIDSLQSSLGASNTIEDRSCRAKLLAAAGKLCAGLLKGNSRFIKAPTKDLDRALLTASDTAANSAFTTYYDETDDGCTTPVPASSAALADVGDLRDSVVNATTTAPNAPTSFTQVIPDTTVVYKGEELSPRCSRDTPYSFFYKRGTTNRLLMYYQGGGACWSADSCWNVPVYKIAAGAGDNPDLVGTGFADPDNVLNIFKDWNVVFVSYCTGDIHWGDNVKIYGGGGKVTWHHGRVNAAVAEKFAREHFIDPEYVFVTGSSAGSYGAIMNSAYLMTDVYPATEFSVLGDAGIGVVTQPWLEQNIASWNVEKNLPTFIPGIQLPIKELSMPKVIEALAAAFPNNRFASYESAYDGGNGGQTSFYHVMKSGNNVLSWPNWWQDQCEWNACMRQFVQHAAATASNYRYYTGAGSRHTIYGSDKLYTDTRGLTPAITFRDWVQSMINDDVGWVNLDCADGGDCDLVDTCQGGPSAGLPCATNGDCTTGISCDGGICTGGGFHVGETCSVTADCEDGVECELDPRPSPLAAPYEPGGIVNCPVTACPCGPTGVNCP